MDRVHHPDGSHAVLQEPSADERHWRGRQPVFTSLVHTEEGTLGRNTSIAEGAEIEASDRSYTVDRDGSLRREGKPLSKKARRKAGR